MAKKTTAKAESHKLTYRDEKPPRGFGFVDEALNFIGRSEQRSRWGKGSAWQRMPFRMMSEQTIVRYSFSARRQSLVATKATARPSDAEAYQAFAKSRKRLFDAMHAGKLHPYIIKSESVPHLIDLSVATEWLDDLPLLFFAGRMRDPSKLPVRQVGLIVFRVAQIRRLVQKQKVQTIRKRLSATELATLAKTLDECAERGQFLYKSASLWTALRPALARYMGRPQFEVSVFSRLQHAERKGRGSPQAGSLARFRQSASSIVDEVKTLLQEIEDDISL